MGAGLVARKAAARGLTRRPWVKTSLAPGSKVVVDYLDRAGLLPDLAKLGFDVVGFGCTTCIGNSGPLPPPIAAAADEHGLALVSVLSGNRNFEGRINPDVRMNYLASPPLVVAYALAGTMDVDLTTEPLATDPEGNDVYLRDLWPTSAEVNEVVEQALESVHVPPRLRRGVRRRRPVAQPAGGRGRGIPLVRHLHLRPPPALLRRHARRAGPAHRHRGGACPRAAGRQRHDRPHLPRRRHPPRQPRRAVADRPRRPAARLQLVRVTAGQPRGDDPGHVRQRAHPQPAGAGHRGRRDGAPAVGRADVDLRRRRALPGRGRAAGRAGREGVRVGLVAGLGGQGHRAARRAGGGGRELRAHPPVEPHRHGRAPAADPRRRHARGPGHRRRAGRGVDVHDPRHRRRRPGVAARGVARGRGGAGRRLGVAGP